MVEETAARNYTIPRTTRELQPRVFDFGRNSYYTIPRTTRELQPNGCPRFWRFYYTIPRTTRELQQNDLRHAAGLLLYHTKNYQGTTTPDLAGGAMSFIIPYQELPGNYNCMVRAKTWLSIIPYQELPGNYNRPDLSASSVRIIPYQELPGNYNR